jgi:hypothetical protein
MGAVSGVVYWVRTWPPASHQMATGVAAFRSMRAGSMLAVCVRSFVVTIYVFITCPALHSVVKQGIVKVQAVL